MRRLFFGIALAAGMLGLWGWDTGVVAAPTPPVATDTETAAKLDRLQWRLDELERKEREYLGLRERDQKETEKRLREFESGVKLDVENETQKAKEWVEYGNNKIEWWLTGISLAAAIFGVITFVFSLISIYFTITTKNESKNIIFDAEKILNEIKEKNALLKMMLNLFQLKKMN